MQSADKYWAVIPAAGVGQRMQANQPKQYLKIQGRTVLDWTIFRLLETQLFTTIVVSLSSEDAYWSESEYASPPDVIRAPGGAERSDSVRQGLAQLLPIAASNDWVLVHDAARPCVASGDIRKLISLVVAGFDGGLLGSPVADTLKQVSQSSSLVESTLDRTTIWRAFTPQMFRLKSLYSALVEAQRQGWEITDEASAMERVGVLPLMVEGSSDNIKITRPEDLQLAQNILSAKG